MLGAVLGLGLALAPTAANAATPTPAPTVASTVTTAAATLPSPVDQSSYEQTFLIYSQIYNQGRVVYNMPVKALHGATVTVTVNGHAATGVANSSGIAFVEVTFIGGSNSVSLMQSLGGQTSAVSTYYYQFEA